MIASPTRLSASPDAGPRDKRHTRAVPLSAIRAMLDVGAILAAFAISYQAYTTAIRAGTLVRELPSLPPYVVAAALFAALAMAAFVELGLYGERATVLNLGELRTVLKGLALAAAFFFALLFFLNVKGYSRLVVVGAIALASVFVVVERRAMSALMGKLQRAGKLGRRVLIYGIGDTGRLVMKKILQAPHLGRTVVGFIDDTAPEGTPVECRVSQDCPIFRASVVGRLADLPLLASLHRVDELFVAACAASAERTREILELAHAAGVTVALVPRLGDLRVDQLQMEDLSAIPILRSRSLPSRRLYLISKRIFDLVGASLAIVLTAPAWIVFPLVIRLESEGPGFFEHERVGQGGRTFRMLKFRTMRIESDPYAPSPKWGVDPRITPFGRLLRATGLDELPQLFNVLNGEMSLVGPRPEMPFIVEQYGALERQRLSVKPGLTGLWQVSADRHEQIHENVEYDLYYAAHQSLSLDLLILVETVILTVRMLITGIGSRIRQAWRPERAPRAHAASSALAVAANGHSNGKAVANRGGSGYVLVALDQRRNGIVPAAWERVVPLAASLGRNRPVKILAAADNRAAFDRLFADIDPGGDVENRQTSYVPYRARGELRELTLGAWLVITDMLHVTGWAADGGIGVIWASPTGLVWQRPIQDRRMRLRGSTRVSASSETLASGRTT